MKTTHEIIKEMVADRDDITLAQVKAFFTEGIFDPVEESKKPGCTKYGCPACGNRWSVYTMQFNKVHLDILKKVFIFCIENKVHEFHKSEIPGLSHTQYGNFCFLQRFGFLYFLEEDGKRIKGGYWGAPVKRIYKFLQGQAKCSKYTVRNTATGTNIASEEKILVSQVPKFDTVINQETLQPVFVAYEASEKEEEEAAIALEEQRQDIIS